MGKETTKNFTVCVGDHPWVAGVSVVERVCARGDGGEGAEDMSASLSCLHPPNRKWIGIRLPACLRVCVCVCVHMLYLNMYISTRLYLLGKCVSVFQTRADRNLAIGPDNGEISSSLNFLLFLLCVCVWCTCRWETCGDASRPAV